MGRGAYKSSETAEGRNHQNVHTPLFQRQRQSSIQCDAPQLVLEDALLQNRQPVGHASRALTLAETRYAQIEKELPARSFSRVKGSTHTSMAWTPST